MNLASEALECAPLHLRPIYRLAREGIFSLIVVSVSGGVELSCFRENRPTILVVRDDASADAASPFLARENMQRNLAQCELVEIFTAKPEPLQVLDVASYVSIFATDAAIIETLPARSDEWVRYASEVNAGDMHITLYKDERT